MMYSIAFSALLAVAAAAPANLPVGDMSAITYLKARQFGRTTANEFVDGG